MLVMGMVEVTVMVVDRAWTWGLVSRYISRSQWQSLIQQLSGNSLVYHFSGWGGGE